jgi:hypothetical protein
MEFQSPSMPCFNVDVPKSIFMPFPACRGFNDPAPLSTSNHIQTNFKPSSHEPSSRYSKFHTLAAILVSIRVNSRLKRFWGNQVAPPILVPNVGGL